MFIHNYVERRLRLVHICNFCCDCLHLMYVIECIQTCTNTSSCLNEA